MTSDLVERLRKLAERERPYGSLPDTLDEAAARIERLEAEGDKARARGDKLRMALEDIAYGDPLHNENDMMRIARTALEGK